MKNILRILALLGLPILAMAQTPTPNTTLCGAQTLTAVTVCLTSTTGIVNQTGVWVDQEYELVQLANSQVVCAGPCQVPVSRANRASGSGPTQHVNASVAWLEYTPTQTVIPGVSGFVRSTQFGDIGPCVRTSIAYLPHIWPDRAVKRDCTATGVWVDYAPGSGLDNTSPTPITTIVANSALSVSSGNYVLLTKAGVIALTLGAPTSGVEDGMVITISANNGANADTLTATGLLQTGGAASPYTTATFGVTSAFNGASLTLRSYGGFWFVISSVNVTFS